MEEVLKMFQKIQIDISKQKEDMRNMEENIKQSINKNIDEKFSTMELKTIELESKIEEQQLQIDRLEREVRKKNLIFFGVEETEKNYNELQNMILDIINNIMGISCQYWEIESFRRMGRKGNKLRPIAVTFTTVGRKIELLRKRKSLESSDTTSSIYIKEDFPPKVLSKRKQLQEEIKREREQGKNVILKYDKIITIREKEHKNRQNKRNLSLSPEAKTYRGNSPEKLTQTAKKNKTIRNFFELPKTNEKGKNPE